MKFLVFLFALAFSGCGDSTKGGDDTIAVQSVKIENALTLQVGETATLVPTILPANATDKTVTWQAGDENIVTVDKTGKVTAVAAGTTFVNVITNSGQKRATCSITVPGEGPERVVLAYVISWSGETPDPSHVTHINYAFAQVRNNNGVWNSVNMGSNIADNNPNRLKMIVGLKKKNPALKVLLSIGGWGGDGFSQMAANAKWRKEFAVDCKRVVDEFGLDGIDIDWEFPGTDMAGIAASPADKANYTYMMQEIRAAIGPDKLLTLASSASPGYYNFRDIEPIIDFVNIMTYDMENPPKHHSALYPSAISGWTNGDKSVTEHIAAGCPAKKLTLGIPFYGRASKTIKPGGDNFVPWYEIAGLSATYPERWSDEAKVPYLVDNQGNMVLSFDNPRSIGIKCQYVKDKGMLGAMYWDYSQDDAGSTLRKAVYNGIMGK